MIETIVFIANGFQVVPRCISLITNTKDWELKSLCGISCSAPRKIKNPGDDLLSHRICSTIGAGELNCRVRDGNGCGLSAIVTRKSDFIFTGSQASPSIAGTSCQTGSVVVFPKIMKISENCTRFG